MTVVFGTGGIATLTLETVDAVLPSFGPAVRVTVSGVSAMTTFTLTTLCEGTTTPVPGWRAKQIIDTFSEVDWCAPTNRPVTYSLMVAGAVVASATITLPTPFAWLQDPLQPDKSLPVLTDGDVAGYLTMRGDALKNADYNSGAQPIRVLGSKYPVGFGGQVTAGSKINTSVRCTDAATASRMRALRSEAPILLLRTTTDMVPLPPLAYLQADVSEQPVTVHNGGNLTRWVITGDLVAAVLRAALTGSVTYDQVQQLLAGYTYDQVQAKAAATTYLDWQKNPLIFSTL